MQYGAAGLPRWLYSTVGRWAGAPLLSIYTPGRSPAGRGRRVGPLAPAVARPPENRRLVVLPSPSWPWPLKPRAQRVPVGRSSSGAASSRPGRNSSKRTTEEANGRAAKVGPPPTRPRAGQLPAFPGGWRHRSAAGLGGGLGAAGHQGGLGGAQAVEGGHQGVYFGFKGGRVGGGVGGAGG